MASLTYSQLLGNNREFRWLWSGQVISELGNWFNFVAGLGLLRVVSGADPIVAANLLVARTLPFAIFAPLAGALVDRFSRWQVLFWSDLARAVVALGFLLIKTSDDIWIAYVCTILLSFFTAFFEAAKNASLPNVTGDDGLLAGNALMFSSRFLLMSIGAGLGGWASAAFGYQAAFLINSISFVLSAYSIWLIPAATFTNEKRTTAEISIANSFSRDFRDGWKFVAANAFVLTVILTNVLWAVGGGAINLLAERLGGIVYAERLGWQPDSVIAMIYFVSGAGLFFGMLVARRVGDFVFMRKLSVPFIGWTLILHGILFALVGVTNLFWLVLVLYFISRFLLGVEYAVQETLLMQAIPDNIRGRVMTIDRAAEISTFSFSAHFSGVSLQHISPQLLTIITALISGSSGVLWFLRMYQNSEIPKFQESKIS